MNNQPLRIVLVRSEEARARLLACMGEGNRAKTASAPLVAILAADLDFHDELPKTFPHFPGARDLFAGNEEGREQAAKLNAALQIGYFTMGVRAAGLAAGPMTGLDAAAVDREFFPDGRHRTMVVMNIGKPGEDAWMQRLPRLDYDEVVSAV
jgi:3-hydroxypropanoate dehydrogenase